MSKEAVDYERIYLNQSKNSGRMRIADSGLGWKPSATGGGTAEKTFLLAADQIVAAYWSRGSRGFETRIYTKNSGVVSFDGFDQNDFNSLKNTISKFFNNVQLEHREHSLRGWNWGKTDLARDELVFNINNRPDFEIPYSEISNSNLTGKNEVTIEMSSADSGAKAGDELVEVRLYIPGQVEYDEKDEADETQETQEDKSLASVFYEQLKDKASIGQFSGDAIVTFSDVLFLTPRGRYDIEMYATSLRLRGKTYDYKVQYKQIERIFSLPKLDGIHHLMVLQIDPPLRQGQTRYPFLVIQFQRDEEMEVELNLEQTEYEQKYKSKLEKSYDEATHLVMSKCFKGLTDTRVITPGSFTSKYAQPGISCSLKASEGSLYPLEKGFLFVTKPTIYFPFSDIVHITMSRAGTSTTSRTFDMEINSRSGGANTFGNINKEEQELVEQFCKSHGIVVKNDEKEQAKAIAAAMRDVSDGSDVDMGSAGEDDSVDEDFSGDSDSDVAEEFDSDASSGSESGDDEPPTKKAKN